MENTMKNSVVEKLNHFISSEIEKICNEYEQKIQLLEQQNEKLMQELEHCRQQLLALESNDTNNKANENYEPAKFLPDKKAIYIKNIIASNTNTPSINHFSQLVSQCNDLILKSEDEDILKAVLKKYLDITFKNNRIQITKVLDEDNSGLVDYLITNPTCIFEKLQLFSKLKLTTYANRFIETLLTEQVAFLKNTLSPEQLAHLFWYAYLYNYQELYLKHFNNIVTVTNPLTSIYFKRVNQKSEKKYTKEVRQLLNSMDIFNDIDRGIIKNKLIRKNVMNSADSSNSTFPIIHTIFVIKEIDKSKVVQKFSLKRATISITLVDNANNKSQKNIEAFIDEKQTKAYITDKQYATYLDQFAPFRPKISNYYYDFKWPSTEIVNRSTTEDTPLQKVSDLKSMGYSYILNSNKRWAILSNAVNKIGLKKVAYTLATNTKRLKGRKPKSPAIAIWEADLAKLKLEFYKNGFQWPSTKL